MFRMLTGYMEIILNEVTNTVHRQETGRPERRAACGSTFHISHDKLRVVSEAEPGSEATTTKCGRCFEDGGGY
jgi:hypothetical protein